MNHCESCRYGGNCDKEWRYSQLVYPCEKYDKVQTNEEWFCTLSTEEKAHQLHLMTSSCYVCGADGVDYKRCYFRKECTGEADILDWLKEVHR